MEGGARRGVCTFDETLAGVEWSEARMRNREKNEANGRFSDIQATLQCIPSLRVVLPGTLFRNDAPCAFLCEAQVRDSKRRHGRATYFVTVWGTISWTGTILMRGTITVSSWGTMRCIGTCGCAVVCQVLDACWSIEGYGAGKIARLDLTRVWDLNLALDLVVLDLGDHLQGEDIVRTGLGGRPHESVETFPHSPPWYWGLRL